MDTRKVQVTGGSTFVVSLPKEWADANDIDRGTEVALFTDNSSLTIEKVNPDKKTEGILDITGLDVEHVKRAVISMYVAGFDVITFKSDRITGDQRRSLREASQKLSGLEVIEETGDKVVFQDLLDSSNLSVHKTVSRMNLIAQNMFKDSISAVTTHQEELSDNVIERDEDVDRMFATISRLFRSSLRHQTYVDKLGTSREECFDLHTTARQLERIADHSTKIARLSKEIDGESPERVEKLLDDMSNDAIDIVDIAVKSLLELDDSVATTKANRALDSVDKMDQYSRKVDEELQELESHRAQILGLMVDSISRTADYGANIAETSLHHSTPTSAQK